MPDWSYRTVLRPLLVRLPPAAARDLSLALMGTLGRSPFGPAVIDFMGHMRAPRGLRRQHLGLNFPTVVGLGCGLDPCGRAASAFARFGIGFIEIGPVTLAPISGARRIERSETRASIVSAVLPDNPGAEAIARALSCRRSLGIPLIARLGVSESATTERAADDVRQIVVQLAPHVAAFSVSTTPEQLRAVVQAAKAAHPSRPVLVCVPAAGGAADGAGADGFIVDGALRTADGRREIGRPARDLALETVSRLRRESPPSTLIIGSGGVHEPEDALRFLEAGADLVQVDSGLVFSGPGLPKRINEAVHYAAHGAGREEEEGEPAERSWFWSALMGAGMLVGSLMALLIASTRVVLPYDEQFAGLSRVQLHAINDRLLAFMAHDRVTLAGTMITIGLLYTSLSVFGIRRGMHWARVTVLFSAFLGFASFFLFLGFGYFDPFHAFVTAILFQFFLLGLHCRMGEPHAVVPPSLRDDWRWQLSQWGQLALISEAAGFIVAGLTVCVVGVTQVFVVEDLEFMQTTRQALVDAGSRVIPLVAHDRATFGGMLLVSGVTFLLTSLWGFRRGARWLWWTVFLAGLCGYGPALCIHYSVGYHSLWHLAPAWAGLGLFLTAMALSYPYLGGADAALEEEWRQRRAQWEARAQGASEIASPSGGHSQTAKSS
jgi:dihydroorotate dehydrogenase